MLNRQLAMGEEQITYQDSIDYGTFCQEFGFYPSDEWCSPSSSRHAKVQTSLLWSFGLTKTFKNSVGWTASAPPRR